MGHEYVKRPAYTPGLSENPQRLTQSSTATVVKGYGYTIIVSSGPGDKTFKLGNPLRAGTEKIIIADVNSTGEVTVIPLTTSQTFFGTTHATLKFTTGAGAGVHPKRARLVGVSKTQWALVDASTGVTTAA